MRSWRQTLFLLAALWGMGWRMAQAAPLDVPTLKQAAGLIAQGKAAEGLALLDGAEVNAQTPAGLVALQKNFQSRALDALGKPALGLKRVQEAVALLTSLPPDNKDRQMGLEGLLAQEALLRRSVWRPDHEAFLKNWRALATHTPPHQLIKAAQDLGQTAQALDWARQWAASSPKDFLAQQSLVNALKEDGKTAQALQTAPAMQKLAATPDEKLGAAVSEALLWVDLGNAPQAMKSLQKSPVKGLSPLNLAKRHHTLGIAHTQDGRTRPALADFDTALELAQKLVADTATLVKEGKSPPAALTAATLQSRDLQTGAWAEKARTQLLLGDFKKAYDGYTQAIALNPPFGQRLQMLTARGVVLERQGFAASALREHQAVASLAAKSGLWPRVAVALSNQATALRESGKPAEAMRQQWAALWVDDLTGNLPGLVVDYENIARLWLQRKNPALARAYVNKARRAQKDLDWLLRLRLGRTEGEACRQGRDFSCARTVFENTATLAQEGGNLDILWMAQAGLARTLRDSGDLSASAPVFEQALQTIETMRLLSGNSPAERARFLVERLPVYMDLLRVYLKLGRPEEAFATLERMRARTLLDRLQQSGSRLDEELTPRERDQERLLELGVKVAFEELNATRSPDARRRYQDALARLESFRKTLDAKYPKLAFFRGRGGKPSPGVVARYLKPEDLLLLQHTDDEGTVLFTISRDGFEAVELPALKKPQLAVVVRDRLRASIAQGVWGVVQERTAQALHRALLAPVLAKHPQARVLLFSPDETLSELPLGVLMDEGGVFLSQKMPVLNVPSATTWTFARSIRGAPSTKADWLVLANPVFADKSLAPLAGTEAEGKRLRHLFPRSVRLFTQNQATETRVKQKGNGAALLHFATHGLLNTANPMQSRVALAKPQKGGEDGFLEVREIMGLDLGASLVVLSACDSARGEALAGEGLQGLAQAFLRAGAPRVMATLWEVNDASTSFLVQHFYENLKKMDVALAMQRAQAATRDKFGPNPFFWSPFVLLGPGWEGGLKGG